MMVWLVYAQQCVVTSHAWSHVSAYSSIKIRISSGTVSVGWVSFIWNTYLSGSFMRSDSLVRNFFTASWIEADTKKYCCLSRSSLP